MPKPPPPSSPFWKAWEAFTSGHVRVFRATKGRVGGRWYPGGAPVLLLHHVGRKSGKHRVSPLIYLADGSKLVIVASKGGVDQHPAWFHNLRAAGTTEVELKGGEQRRVRVRTVEGGEEHDRLWPRLVELYGPYEDYQRFTSRERIPLAVLEPV